MKAAKASPDGRPPTSTRVASTHSNSEGDEPIHHGDIFDPHYAETGKFSDSTACESDAELGHKHDATLDGDGLSCAGKEVASTIESVLGSIASGRECSPFLGPSRSCTESVGNEIVLVTTGAGQVKVGLYKALADARSGDKGDCTTSSKHKAGCCYNITAP